jgi:hypothetical protein
MQAPTSSGIVGDGVERSGPQLSGESGPDLMMCGRSGEYQHLLINEFVIGAYALEFSMTFASIRLIGFPSFISVKHFVSGTKS